MQLARKYLIGSVILHMVVIIVATIIGLHQNSIKKTFVVFGAHSRKHSFVTYKPTKIVPFVNQHKVTQPKRKLLAQNNHGKGKGRHANGRSSNHKAASKATKQTRNKKVAKKTHVKQTKHKPIKSKVKTKPVKTVKPIHKAKSKPTPRKIVASKVPELEEAGDKIKMTSKKQKSHKPAPKAKIKKTEPKPEPKQEPEEKPEPATKPEPEPIEPPKAVASAIPANQDDIAHDDISPEDEDPATDGDDNDEGSIIDFNLIGDADDQQRKVYQKHVQREVDRLWRPPVGVSKGTVCTVLFSVNAEGEVEEVKFLKRSSMLIYDLSIMRIAKSFKFAHCLWNKQFKIDFKQ